MRQNARQKCVDCRRGDGRRCECGGGRGGAKHADRVSKQRGRVWYRDRCSMATATTRRWIALVRGGERGGQSRVRAAGARRVRDRAVDALGPPPQLQRVPPPKRQRVVVRRRGVCGGRVVRCRRRRVNIGWRACRGWRERGRLRGRRRGCRSNASRGCGRRSTRRRRRRRGVRHLYDPEPRKAGDAFSEAREIQKPLARFRQQAN